MAEPVRHLPLPPDEDLDDETSEPALLQRWVERPDGHLELVEMPLTPELFLDPQLEDKMVQGPRHSEVTTSLVVLLRSYLQSKRDDVLVLSDVKHYLIPGFPSPAPDVSVIYGIRWSHDEEWPESFDVAREGVRPSLVIEVVSPKDARIRRTDKKDKVQLYQQAGIPEYLIVDPPRRKTGFRFQWTGYRLDSWGRYRSIEPDADGALLSETTGVRFNVSPRGDLIIALDPVTGKELQELISDERVQREIEARNAAEAEVLRLREELERLKE